MNPYFYQNSHFAIYHFTKDGKENLQDFYFISIHSYIFFHLEYPLITIEFRHLYLSYKENQWRCISGLFGTKSKDVQPFKSRVCSMALIVYKNLSSYRL